MFQPSNWARYSKSFAKIIISISLLLARGYVLLNAQAISRYISDLNSLDLHYESPACFILANDSNVLCSYSDIEAKNGASAFIHNDRG